MVKAINDDEIKLRKRARRRLIGAVALVLLAILVLPLVLDHEPAPLAPDVAVIADRKSAAEKSDFSSKVMPVPPSGPPAESSESPAPMPAPVPAVEKPAAVSAPKSSAPGPVVSPAESEPIEGREPEKTGSPPRPASRKETDTAKLDKAEKSTEEPKPAARAADAKPKKTSPAVAAKVQRNDTFAIQLESFANAANARQLQEKLAANGVKSYTEVVETRQGKRTRVRVGPFATREAAEQALGKLKESGFSGIVRP
ncbi:MAG: SPOR domain-containing protein [Burkholderiales bacterium]|nr:SPOR domain-containing protein [Burkholderiales bacterium]MDQ3196133.1 SPOR domain-containing protein [Pseudomonadota bacterium]